jgi:hypothetical protein
MSTVEVFGYSERGIINSIVFFLKEHPERIQGFLEVLDLKDDFFRDCNYTFLNEQSFSDFGDNDWTIIAEKGEKTLVIFIEAKIKPIQGKFEIKKELEKCKKRQEERKGSSDIFTQLYYKYLLAKKIDENSKECSNSLLGKETKKLGNNEIVRNAYCKYIKGKQDYCYTAILPVKIEKNEFRNYFSQFDIPTEKIFCAYWGEIETYFKDIEAKSIIDNFAFNKDEKTGKSQIYNQ